MADFFYRAYRGSGAETKGRITADDALAARQALRAQGLLPSELSPASLDKHEDAAAAMRGIPLDLLASWSARMEALLAGGVPLDKALGITARSARGNAMTKAAQTMLAAVREGAKPADAAQVAGLSPDVHGLLRAADSTGDLAAAFHGVAANSARALARKRAITTALTYPGLLVCVAVSAFFFMLMVIVPRFEPIFARSLDTLPASTRYVLALSGFVQVNWMWILGGGLLLFLLLAQKMRTQSAGPAAIGIIGWLPGGGKVRMDLLRAQMLGQFADFLQAGLTLPHTLGLVRGGIDDAGLNASLGRVSAGVETGGLLSDALESENILPDDLLSVVRAGEESGALVEMFRLAATTAGTNADASIKRLLIILEPVLILSIGVIVGGMILSIFQAVLSINDVVI